MTPAIKSITSALKGKSRKSEESSTRDSEAENHSPEHGYLPEPPGKSRVDTPSTKGYLLFLKLLYTDKTLEDLTATLNHCQGTDLTAKEVSDFFIQHYNFAIRMREERNWGTKPPFPRADVATNAAYMWLRPTNFAGKWTEHDYNQPIRDLARYRRIYENFMRQLDKPVSSELNNFSKNFEAVERLSKPGPIHIMDLRDLSPQVLTEIYVLREMELKELGVKDEDKASDRMGEHVYLGWSL
ncbi:MAG: hypothetical protein Q9221_006014 [Calogaya cf. arnoldii]